MRKLENDVTLPIDVQAAWDLFTSAEGIVSWMARKAKVDLRVGGSIKTHYDPLGVIGDENTIVAEILSLDPPRMISTRNVQSPASTPFRDALARTWSVTYLEEVATGVTKVRIVGLGYGDSPEADAAYRFFEQANPRLLEGLRRRLQGG
jgi:uncharacterized protein YndB with AHSA1/START domain